MDFKELLAADVAVDMKLLTPEEAAQGGVEQLSEDDRARVAAKVERLLGESKQDARLALAKRGLDRKLTDSLPPKTSHAVSDIGARVRAPLRTLASDRYTGFLPLGEGGMGIVYLALDTELNRKVAFKMVRSDSSGPLDDTPRTLPDETEIRFLQEAWVTGGLEHPGVVPVYELGRTPSGVPYYTMRVVRGERTLEDAITEATTPEERLALLEPFLKVCDAIRYAHSRRVIHRDLKPANVALGPFGEVVVLDWGLAKMHDRPDITASVWQDRLQELRSDSNLSTLTSSMGTPGYMAPEAALGEVQKVDERADVYSLGAILYRILAGKLPIKFANYIEFVANVAEGVEDVPGAPAGLANICLKALSTKRDERWGDVRELSDAIRAWQSETAIDREVLALTEQAEATLKAAETMEGEAQLRELDRTVALAARIRELRPDHPRADELTQTARDMRARAIEAREADVRKRLMRRVGVVGLITATAATIVVALMLNARRQEAEDARAKAEKERARAEELAGFMLGGLSDGLRPIGRLDLLGKVARESLEYYETLPKENITDETWRGRGKALRSVGEVLFATGDLRSAESSYRSALAIAEKYGRPRDLVKTLIMLSDVEVKKGQLKPAKGLIERALKDARELAKAGAGTDSRSVSVCLNRLGDVRKALGDTRGALAAYEESLRVSRELLEKDPDDPTWLRTVSVALDRLGNIQKESGDMAAALATFEESLKIAQRLLKARPKDRLLQRDLFISYWKLATLERLEKGLKAAAPRYLSALEIARSLAAHDPTNSVWQMDLADALRMAGDIHSLRKDLKTAEQCYRESLQIVRRLSKRDPANRAWRKHLAIVLAKVGDVEMNLHRNYGKALALHQEALEISKELAAAEPDNLDWQKQLASSYVRIGDLQNALLKRKDALGNFKEGLKLSRKIAARDPKNPSLKVELAVALYRVGTNMYNLGLPECESVLKEALDTHAEAVELAPHNKRRHYLWERAYHGAALIAGKREPKTTDDFYELGMGHYRRGAYAESVVAFENALADEKIRKDLNKNALYNAACAAALMTGEEAKPWHDKAVKWLAENTKMRRDALKKLEAELAAGATGARKNQVEFAVGILRDQIKWTREGDKELDSLRGRDDFKAIFPELKKEEEKKGD